VQAAVAASADLKAAPSNLEPPLANATAELKTLYLNACMRTAYQVSQLDCATGDTASTTGEQCDGLRVSSGWNSPKPSAQTACPRSEQHCSA
jgi:hypothetical protein